MRVFELATALGPDCFEDAQALIANPITNEIAGQLYAAVVKDRRDRLEEMRRLLLAIIPRERGRAMK
jgi:hypothetical protein